VQLKVAICEDDVLLCKEAENAVLRLKPDYCIDTFQNGEELLKTDKNYDLIFLDIEMPGKDGLSVAKELRSFDYAGHLIFLTSHTEVMPEAFKVKAFRFLSKPLKSEELMETLTEAEKEIDSEKKLLVTIFEKEVLINISEISYIQARRNKTIIYTKNEELETPYPLKYWQDKLETSDFFQVHKSYLVSLRYVCNIETDTVLLRGGEDGIPLSRRKSAQLKQVFFEYVKEHAHYI
jgi:DNA-binding LytR/AlgR family response regulator